MRTAVILMLLTLGYCQYRLWIASGALPDSWAMQREVTRLTSTNEGLELRNTILREEIRELRKGEDAVEELARTELGMIGRDETFFLIVD